MATTVDSTHRPSPRRSARSHSLRARSPSFPRTTSAAAGPRPSFATSLSFSEQEAKAATSPATSLSSSSGSGSAQITKNLSSKNSTKAKTRALSPEPPSTRVLESEGGFELQDITRKVVRTFEGLTGVTLDMAYFDVFGIGLGAESSDEEKESEDGEREKREEHDEEEREVAKELLLHPSKGMVEGLKMVKVEIERKTVDWEIPRKALHSSIGFLTLYLYLSPHSPRTVVYVLWSALAIIAPADWLRLRNPGFERTYEKVMGFLMRESEKKSTNGVIWYIIGVNFALTFYPLDVAVVSILILSWADTAASTIGRLWGGHWGYYSPKLPARLPLIPFLSYLAPSPSSASSTSSSSTLLNTSPSSSSSLRTRLHRFLSQIALPMAPRKSLAGFLAASLTGAMIAFGFWRWIAPTTYRLGQGDVTWAREGCVGVVGVGNGGGWIELGLLAVWAGLVSGVAEALDLGSLDDNLTLPIMSGGCLWAFFKILGWIRA